MSNRLLSPFITRRFVILTVLTLGLVVTASRCTAAEPDQLTVSAAVDCSTDLLVRVPLPSSQDADPGRSSLQGENGQLIPAQIRSSQEGRELVWRLEAPLAAGQTRTWRWLKDRPESGSEKEIRQRIEDRNGNLIFQERERPLLAYNLENDPPPAGVSPLYTRSGYVHPLYSPAGHVLTDDFPPDHYHQHGLFFAWVNTSVGATPVDFWNQGKGLGTVRHEQLVSRTSGKVFSELVTQLAHVQSPQKAEERVVLREQWNLLLHSSDQLTITELFSSQQNVTSEPVTLEKHHYGGFGIRGSRNWSPLAAGGIKADFLTSSGKNREQGNHTPAEWVRMSGPISGQESSSPPTASITVISHRENLRSPQKVRLHPEKPYFCFCPVVDEAFVLQPGAVLKSRYLIITSDGELTPEEINRIQSQYFSPLTVKWE